MTRLDEIKERLFAIESRSNEILEATETAEGNDLQKLADESKTLAEERKALETEKAEIEAREKMAEEIRKGTEEAKKVKTPKDEERGKKIMTLEELRNNAQYIDAFAEGIKTGDFTEARSVATENGSGDLPVPTMVSEIIHTAWENDGILSRVSKISVKGNYKESFELSATDAVVHKEGADAPAEEKLELGTVELVAETLKKWITITDEAYDLRGEAFLDYIYNEITHKIVKKAADTVVAKIDAAPQTATKTAPSVAKVATAGLTDFINAVAALSDEATNPVIIMNKQSYAYYRGLALAANYPFDVFDGLTVLFNNTLTAADGTATGTYAIVGDLGEGVKVNFPNGETPTFKFDDLSLAEKDLIKVVGRCPAAIEVVADKAFAKIVKE